MRLLLKRLLRHPYTYRELRQDSDGFFVNPPLPPDLFEASTRLRADSGESLLDQWRRFYDDELRTIAKAPTWQAQRAALLRTILQENSWRALLDVVTAKTHPQAWAHVVVGTPLEKAEEQHRTRYLSQRFFLAITTGACLTVLGQRRYALDEGKSLETEAFYLVEREMRGLDVRAGDFPYVLLDRGDEEQALAVAAFRELRVDPIIQEQMNALNLAEEQIINGRLDVEVFRSTMATLERRTSELVAELRAIGASNEAS
jgi:hypothetical protein